MDQTLTDHPAQGTTLSQKVEWVQMISLFPALTIMVFLRRRLGFRMLRPTWLIAMTALLLLLAALCRTNPENSNRDSFILTIYALGFLGMGAFQRYQRWKELTGGSRWHTYSSGISWLESLPLPLALFRYRRIYRFADPVAAYITAVLVLFISTPLGLWLMLATVFLTIFEQSRYEKALDRDLDILDSLFEVEIHQETVQHFRSTEPKAIGQNQRSLEETAGIPTGVAADIEQQINRRRTKTKVLDNLAS